MNPELERRTARTKTEDKPLTARVTETWRTIVTDPGVQAGLAQIVASLAALAVRAISTRELER